MRRSSNLPMLLGGGIVAGGMLFAGYAWAFGDIHTVKDTKPDEQPTRGKTGFRLLDSLLPTLAQKARASDIPLGLLVGWIAKESGGKLADVSRLDERGYFQLMPSESKSIGLDKDEHRRLSTDSDFSIDAGIKLIRQYERAVKAMNAAPVGSSFYWMLVKLAHTVGEGQTRKLVKLARSADKLHSWREFADYVQTLTVTGPQPKKWMPFLDSLYQIGRPFGFGGDSGIIVSGLSSRRRLTSIMLGIDVFAAG